MHSVRREPRDRSTGPRLVVHRKPASVSPSPLAAQPATWQHARPTRVRAGPAQFGPDPAQVQPSLSPGPVDR